MANGDITSPQKALQVLETTGADGLMIGRAAQGRPWIFREIQHFLTTGTLLPPPEVTEIHQVLTRHLDDLYQFYGMDTGVRVARKHISWYTRGLKGSAAFRHAMNQLQTVTQQQLAVSRFFELLQEQGPRLEYDTDPDGSTEDLAA